MEEDLKKIAEHYGLNHQKIKLIEEMAELTQAICKGNENNIIEEIADVEILLEQVKHLMKINITMDVMKKFKINRQLKRIENENFRDCENCSFHNVDCILERLPVHWNMPAIKKALERMK